MSSSHVAARLAGGCDLEGVTAGKPDCYKWDVQRSIRADAACSVAARLAGGCDSEGVTAGKLDG